MNEHVNKHQGRALTIIATGLALALLTTPGWVHGQDRGQTNQPPSAKAAAAFDPTGYWTSVVTQNWRMRMVPPAKGDYLGIPISAAGKKAADEWAIAKDEAAGNQCKAFGAPAIMNLPTHLHITWQDDNTLKLDTDYGTQTRVFHFGNWAASHERSLQGNSTSMWASRRGGSGGPVTAKYLRITTTDLLSGYLRRNGVPYGESTSLLEYVDLFQEPNGGALMVWTAVVNDPVNLEVPYILTSQFKKVANSSAWDPTPCTLRW
jgi:hypothetical protein